MARDVHNVLRGIIMEYGGLDEQKAEEYIQTLHAKGRYEQDVWS
jgi:sulfite reductase alpha subunit-like flavoprotein